MRIWAQYAKLDAARYVAHLDLQRAMQRALRRSGLPVAYSHGFNPHVVLSFASPLAVGYTGGYEIMDVKMDGAVGERECAQRLNGAMPAGLTVVRARCVPDGHPAPMAVLARADYTIELRTAQPDALIEAAAQLLGSDSYIALRRTKSGERPTDIRPMLHALDVAGIEGGVRIDARLSLTEAATLKPDLLVETLRAIAGLAPGEPPVNVARGTLYTIEDGRAVPMMEMELRA